MERAGRRAWWAAAFWVALSLVFGVVWADINHLSALEGLWLGLSRIGLYAVVFIGWLLWVRYSKRHRKIREREAKEGINSWKW